MKSEFEIDGASPHLGDLTNLDPGAVDIGVEKREPLRPAAHLAERRGARKKSILFATCAVEIQIFVPVTM